jgi:glycosyltransferase involved in cell wall biosynthesis
VLSYGRYVPKKGFDVLLRAFKTLLDSGVDAFLKIGGDGPQRDELMMLIQELGIADHVNLGGWIDDVSAALDRADLFVLPSRDEPFGIVMLEAMARGVPFVTTCTQGPKEVLTDETAFFAEIASVESLALAMAAVVENPLDARNRAERALKLYRTTYYEDAVMPRIEALYQKMFSH